MKSTGTSRWTSPNASATNESGFTGLPGGARNFNGAYGNVGSYGSWWSASEVGTTDAWHRYLNSSDGYLSRLSVPNRLGYSVRCLKD